MSQSKTNLQLTVIHPYGDKETTKCSILESRKNIEVIDGNIVDVANEFKHLRIDKKAKAPLLVGYTLKSNNLVYNGSTCCGERLISRCAKNVDKVTALTIDYDDDSDNLAKQGLERGITPCECAAMLDAMNLSYWIYTSYNYGKSDDERPNGLQKFRAVIPLKSPVYLDEITSRKKTLTKLFKVDDTASFSRSQGFFVPSCSPSAFEQPIQLVRDASTLDLNAIEQDEVEQIAGAIEFSQTANDYFGDRRRKLVDEYQTRFCSGHRDSSLRELAIKLRGLHADSFEIEQTLDACISVFPQAARHEHKGKAARLAQWVTRNIHDLYPMPNKRFNTKFTKLSDASSTIKKALNSSNDLYLLVTAGVGKTRVTAEWVREQAKAGKNVAVYGASNRFQHELQQTVNASVKASKWQSWLDKAIVISGRDQANQCDFTEKVKELQRRERQGLSGLVKEHCLTKCLYSGECNYALALQSAERVRVYTHAHLFTHKSCFDQFKPDIVVIDEDVLGVVHEGTLYT